MLIPPPQEIGWTSEHTATRWGPTFRVEQCVGCLGWGWRFEVISEGLLRVICPDCGGAKAIAVLVAVL